MTLSKKQKTRKKPHKETLDESAANKLLANIEYKLNRLDKDKDAEKIELLNQISQLFTIASLYEVFNKVGRESFDKEIKHRHQLWLDLLLCVKIEILAKIVNDDFTKQDLLEIKDFFELSINKLFDEEFTKIFKTNFAISIEDINRKKKEVELAKINLAESTKKLNMLYDPALKKLLNDFNKDEMTSKQLDELKKLFAATENIIDELVPIIAVPFYQTKDQGVELQLELEKINKQIDQLSKQITKRKGAKVDKHEWISTLETIAVLKEKVLPFVIVSCEHITNELNKMHDEISMLLLMRVGTLETDKIAVLRALENKFNTIEGNATLMHRAMQSE